MACNVPGVRCVRPPVPEGAASLVSQMSAEKKFHFSGASRLLHSAPTIPPDASLQASFLEASVDAAQRTELENKLRQP